MQEWVIASGNAGKIREINALLASYQITLRPQSEWQMVAVEETGLTFVENALLKARAASRISGLPALADDSGLVVPVLKGAPGLYSARYAGDQATDSDNVEKLLQDMRGLEGPQRKAWFLCLLVVIQHPEDPAPLIAEGRWPGQIALAPRGSEGFGYDPVFLPDGLTGELAGLSAAELRPEQKNALSHRGQALQALQNDLLAARG